MTNTDTNRASRNTWQRAAVRDLLGRGSEFRTANQVLDELERQGARVGRATVYRALQAMTDAGEVDVLRTSEGEAAYRRCAPGHHHHLVCRRCGTAVEIADEFIEDWAGGVARQYGFTDIGHELEIFGLCADCS